MENKLQQLTEKLYAEGLAKGQAEGEQRLTAAQTKADQIIEAARSQAATIVENARTEAADLDTGMRNELRLASTQLVSALRVQIQQMITAQVTANAVSVAWRDGEFVKSLMMEALKTFNPTQTDKMNIIVPQEMIEAVENAVKEQFNASVNVVTDSRVKVPFRIAPSDGGYYVSFTEADFNALFRSYIRPAVARLLYGE